MKPKGRELKKYIIAGVATVAAAGVAVPAVASQSGGHSAKSAAPVAATAAAAKGTPFVEYHGKTAAYHVAQYKKLSKSGYRLISLNVSDRAHPKYAAVWLKKSGPAFTEVIGQSRTKFQKTFDGLRKKGYQPTVVTATGPSASALYSGVFEKKGGKFFSWGDLSAAKLASYNKYAAKNGYIPVSIDAYGTAKSPRYLGVWVANPRKVKWSVSLAKSFGAHDKLFKAQVKKGYRTSYVVVGTGNTYSAIWRNDKVGAWAERTGLTSAQLTSYVNKGRSQGAHPIQIAGGGNVYAGIWTK